MRNPNTPSIPVAPNRWPVVGHVAAINRDPLGFLGSLRSLGDVVQIDLGSLPVYFISQPETIHRILVTDVDCFEKGMIFDKTRPFIGNGIMTSGGNFHRRQRLLMQPAFHRTQITRYCAEMIKLADGSVDSWQSGQIVELQRVVDEMTLRVVSTTLFGSELGRVATDEVQRSLPIFLSGVILRALSPVEWATKLPIPANTRFLSAGKRIRDVIDGMITTYRADAGDRFDLLSTLLAAREAETGNGMTDQQVHDELVTILFAGAETTASALGSAFFELCGHPEIQERVRHELQTVVADRSLEFGDIEKLEYTRRFLMEVLRLHTPAWILMRRATTEVAVGSVRLSAGAEVMFSLPVLHRDPNLYPDPELLDPDRWLTRPVRTLPKGSYLPFLEGTRQCIGNSFAWTEMMVIIAAVILRWQLTLTPGDKPRRKFRSVSRLDRLTVSVTNAHEAESE
jgi:cytochrome P450